MPGGVPGVRPARMVVSDGGVAGESAIEMGIGLSAHVAVLDNDTAALKRLSRHSGNILDTAREIAIDGAEFVVTDDVEAAVLWNQSPRVIRYGDIAMSPTVIDMIPEGPWYQARRFCTIPAKRSPIASAAVAAGEGALRT